MHGTVLAVFESEDSTSPMHFYTVDKDKFVYGDTKAKRKFPHVFRMDGRGAVHSSKFKLVRTSPFGPCAYIVLSAHITQVHTASYPDCQMYQRQRYGVVEICARAFVIGFSKLTPKVLGCESGVLDPIRVQILTQQNKIGTREHFCANCTAIIRQIQEQHSSNTLQSFVRPDQSGEQSGEQALLLVPITIRSVVDQLIHKPAMKN